MGVFLRLSPSQHGGYTGCGGDAGVSNRLWQGGPLVFGFAVLVPFYEWFSVSVFTQFSYGFSVSKVTAVCGTGVKSYVDFLFATLFSIGFSVSFLR